MQWIDWVLMILPIALVLGFAVYTHRYVRSVADFLSGGRCAGRYLICNAKGEAASGLANTMSKFEVVLVSGFVLNFWEKVSTPIMLLVGISGFVIYRFRETRAMTLAQFFEMRYSRRFRLFMGGLGFLSGILNYGIFPAVSARFFVYFLGLPTIVAIGALHVPTHAIVMFAYLSCAVTMMMIGGQVTLMVTDCIEGILSHAIYMAIVIAVLFIVSWPQIVKVMEMAPAGKSQMNPFDTGGVEDFNIWFVLMTLVTNIYATMAMQNAQGFNSAARTPHESRMGGVLGHWRGYARALMLLVLGVCALTFMKHPAFATQAAPIGEAIRAIPDKYIQKQMTVPIALRYLLPTGIKGLFCAIMMMGLLAGDAGHMHSWGSIFVQDVILPLKKKAMSPRQHIWMLRFAVIGVALFAFSFSLLWSQTQYIALWWAITAGVFTGGAGAAIIGGLYWRRGTTGAAWSAAITGSVLSLIGIALGSKLWSSTIAPALSDWGMEVPKEKFWFNNQQTAFAAATAAATVYVVVSLLTRRAKFDLDKMLHRGKYAVEASGTTEPLTIRDRFRMKNILRFDKHFTWSDKVVAGGIFWWAMILLAVNVTVSIWNLKFQPWPLTWWSRYWAITGVGIPFLIASSTLVWFSIGGARDIRDFFRALRVAKRDARDDGRVVDHHNLADESASRSVATAGSTASLGNRNGDQATRPLATGDPARARDL